MFQDQPSAPKTDSAERKLASLRELLGERRKTVSSELKSGELRGGSSVVRLTEHPSPLVAISEALFARAPSDYLSRTSIGTMSDITVHTNRLLEEYLNSEAPHLVSVHNFAGNEDLSAYTSITTIISDRPFVVDTLGEYLRANRLEVQVSLHPILEDSAGRRIALTYMEIDRIDSPARLDSMARDIAQVLDDLFLTTDSFSSILVRAESAARLIESAPAESQAIHDQNQEVGEFLRWLADGGFVFLGFREWQVQQARTGHALTTNTEADLGLFCSRAAEYQTGLLDVARDAEHLLREPGIVSFGKLHLQSSVHRRARMDAVLVKLVGRDGAITIQCFLGLLTSKSMAQEVLAVPILRQKLQRLIAIEGFIPNTYDYKELVSIVDSIPKAELFQMDTDTLRHEVALIINLQRRRETRINLHHDPLKRIIFLMVAMPRERFSEGVRQRIQEYVEQKLNISRGTSEYRLVASGEPSVRLHYSLANVPGQPIELNVYALEKEIADLTLTWDERLQSILSEQFGIAQANRLGRFYRLAFPEQYKAATTPEEAAFDVRMLEAVSAKNPLEIAIREGTAGQGAFSLKLYQHQGSLTLSALLPFLENAGLDILNETMTPISLRGDLKAAISAFSVKSKSRTVLDPKIAETITLPGLKQVIEGKADNDELNSLLFEAGLPVQDIAVLRVLASYLWQIQAFTSLGAIRSAIVKYPTLAKLLVQCFQVKFDPDQFVDNSESRAAELRTVEAQFGGKLKKVTNLVHDRALRALLNVIQSTVRTNFYRTKGELRIGLKLDCRLVSELPRPRPLYEIFVNAPEFEGIHLRGGKVARGGIRWSERREDYRTEVLGLMKTQMVKNSIIVPVGAKGGFVVKNLPTDPQAIPKAVERCYKRFVTTLLEMTDNRTAEGLVHPPRTVIYDGDDPYLVVAADKGTATFSDVANEISVREFNFWLQDAFASGGSYGYDHKKLGITARGAWAAANRHFCEVGIDVETQPFTVVGVGDMSGDVFGNGMLLSRKTKLLAAFNHAHIFLDPNPDLDRSFEERKRLFYLPRSQWSDYNRECISKGGGIFERSAKEITLSQEARQSLAIDADTVTGEQLIKAILKSPVDLLFNGGIGTYVKASFERNIEVGDPVNNDVRVDARDLRAKIVCEGGNLGFTQRARIEYSKIGGHINTDAVDNSGGVDTSDLEVNIKILLQGPMRRGELTFDERNKLLNEVVDEVVQKVISRNRSQSKLLSLGVRRSRRNINYYRGLLASLETDGLLDRAVEFLPDDEDLTRRATVKAGLTRPELAILIAYVKMEIFQILTESKVKLTEEPFLHRYLFNYFPRSIVQRFPVDTLKHPLANEIIATQIANTLVERMGATFLYRLAEETGMAHYDIIFAFLAADEIMGAQELNSQLRVMDSSHSSNSYLKALLTLTSSIDGLTRWILEHRNSNLTWSELIDRYRSACKLLLAETGSIVTEIESRRFEEKVRQLLVEGFPKELAQLVSAIVYSNAYLDIIDVATESAFEVVKVAKLYAHIAAEFSIARLLEQAADIETSDRWEALSARVITAELKMAVRQLTLAVIQETGDTTVEALNECLKTRTEIVRRYKQSVREFQNRALTIPALLVITNQLFALAKTAR